MKTSIARGDSSRNLILLWARVFVIAGAMIGAANVSAAPRPSWVGLIPEVAWPLFHETFDESFYYGMTNAQVTVGNFTYSESWSGMALKRSGASVTPYFVPAVEAGQTNFYCDNETFRFWFKPTTWSSATQTNGAGPGAVAVLLDLEAVGKGESANAWGLEISPDGNTLSLTAQSDDQPTLLLQTEISWQANHAYLIALECSPKETALFINGQLAAQGTGVPSVPPQLAVLLVGSGLGKSVAGGDFDELCIFGKPPRARFYHPLTAVEILFYYGALFEQAALGPLSADEIAAREKRFAERKAQRAAALSALSLDGEGGMAAMAMRGTYGALSASDCVTNVPVYMTNVWAGFETNGTVTVTFDVLGGTNGLIYDVFGTTNLAGNQWFWVTNTPTCNTVVLPGQNPALNFYVLGTPQDSDGDGLTDAYENLVSHTNPNVFNIVTSDGYGTPDAWYLQHGWNPATSGLATQDPDQDGLLNWQEYLYGTDPQVSEGINVWVGEPVIFVGIP